MRLPALPVLTVLLLGATSATAVAAPGPAPHVLASPALTTSSSATQELLVAISAGGVWGSGANPRSQLSGDLVSHDAAQPFLGLPDGVAPEQVATVGDSTSYVVAGGTLYGVGANDYQQLGPDPTRTRRVLTAMPGVQGVTPARIVGGPTCLYMVGGGNAYRIGSDTKSHACPLPAASGADYFSFVPGLPADGTVVDVATGGQGTSDAFTVFARSDGSVWGTGAGQFGQLAGTTDLAVATRLPALPDGAHAVAVAAGDYSTLALAADGRIFGTGVNIARQLTGDDDFYFGWHELTWASDAAPAVASIASGPLTTYVLDESGGVHVAGASLGFPHSSSSSDVAVLTPLSLPDGLAAVDAVEGLRAGMALRTADGAVWGWGSNLGHRLTGTATRYDELHRLDRTLAVDAVPVVTGTPIPGSTLTTSLGTWLPAPAATSVQWLRDGSPLAGRTGTSYVVQQADAGHALSARVTVSADGLLSTSADSATVVVPPRLYLAARPSITGRARVGRVLTGRPGSWIGAPTAFGYQWLSDGHRIKGATRARLRIRPGLRGHRLALRVVATRAGCPTEVAVSAPTARVRRTSR